MALPGATAVAGEVPEAEGAEEPDGAEEPGDTEEAEGAGEPDAAEEAEDGVGAGAFTIAAARAAARAGAPVRFVVLRVAAAGVPTGATTGAADLLASGGAGSVAGSGRSERARGSSSNADKVSGAGAGIADAAAECAAGGGVASGTLAEGSGKSASSDSGKSVSGSSGSSSTLGRSESGASDDAGAAPVPGSVAVPRISEAIAESGPSVSGSNAMGRVLPACLPCSAGAEGISGPPSLNGCKGARDAASIMWAIQPRMGSGRIVLLRTVGPQVVPHRTAPGPVPAGVGTETCVTLPGRIATLTPGLPARRLKATIASCAGPFIRRSCAGRQASRPQAIQLRKAIAPCFISTLPCSPSGRL